MNQSLIYIAAILIFATGIVHSVLGELLIFRHLRQNGYWIDHKIRGLRTRQIRSLWSTWHLLTLFGWTLSIVLMIEGNSIFDGHMTTSSAVLKVISLSFGLATPFWFLGTQGKHPAWIVFLIISLLTWFKF